tara:strand:+ start:2684 stop:5401 length:2718 start_codon:yes stop_codon:yes gene_type:complete
MNLSKIFSELLSENSTRIFLIDSSNKNNLTYSEAFRRAASLAFQLRDFGLNSGDRIGINASNSVDLALLYIACILARICVVPVNPELTKQQSEEIFSQAKIRALYCDESAALKLNIHENRLVEIVLSKSAIAGLQRLDFEAKSSPDTLIEELNNNDQLCLIYTSGTTSFPKGVIHKAENLFGNGQLFIDTLGISERSRFINYLPMTYLGGYYNLLLIPMIAGASVVLESPFSPKLAMRFWAVIESHKVDVIWFVPTIISFILELDRGLTGVNYCAKNEPLCLVGTAFLAEPLKNRFIEKYKVNLYENYGLSETLFISTHGPKIGSNRKSVGLVFSNIQVKTFSNEGEELSSGETGNLCVKTPYLMLGYENEDQTDDTYGMQKDWFLTGDLGYIDQSGELNITGRIKDLIIRGGINISPAFIQKVIYSHPNVTEVAVIGIPDGHKGEDVTAILKSDKQMKDDEIISEVKDQCRKQLASYMMPSRFIIIDEFPRTSSGKIIKRKLVSWVMGGINPKQIKPSPRERTYFQPSKIVADAVEAISIKYNCMVYEMKAEGEDITVLSLGEAYFDIPLKSFEDLPFPDIYHYSHSRGVLELRNKLSEYFAKQYQVHFDPESEILVTAGSKIAIHMALMATLNPGDEVIIHEPAWVSYPEQVKLCYGVPVQIPYDVEVFDFENFITNRTKVIIINNPNNPKGSLYSLDELGYLYKLAEKYNLYIVSDEAYSDFLLESDKFTSIGNLDIDKKHLILVNSISKNYGISGWRLGYLITNPELTSQILKLNQHMVTCPPTILAHYIAKHFDELINITKPQIHSVVHKRQKLAQYMESINLKFLAGTATFYFFVSIEGSSLSSEEFCLNLLRYKKIAVVPGIGYGKSCDRFIRVSIGAESWDRCVRALDTIKQYVDET